MNTTFDSIFNDYASYMRVRLKPQSYRTSISRFKLYVLNYFKDYDIHTLNAKDIIKYQDYLMSLPYRKKNRKDFVRNEETQGRCVCLIILKTLRFIIVAKNFCFLF